MKRIRVIGADNHHMRTWAGDIERIVSVLAANGYEATPEQACRMWELFSESMCAGWMTLPRTDEGVMSDLGPFFEAI